MQRKIVTTSDGSHSIFIPEMDEHYHSTHGAIQEAQHVFLKNGLHPKVEEGNALNILEVGLGTGLNLFLTWLEVQESQHPIKYYGLEAFPVTFDMAKQLNYVKQLTGESAHPTFDQIHKSEWETEVELTPNFVLAKIESKLQEFESDQRFDLVYFDAFGPRAQAEMWAVELFLKLFKLMNRNGILVTYCAKGQVRRDMQSVGFEVERLPGPPGKREMLRAIKRV